jgi:ABC-type polysaccharide/polyol phosphate export permease
MTVYSDLYRFRELFANLFRRDFQAKYKGSLLGIVWSLLNPLLLLAVYLIVFGVLFPNTKTVHYPIYLLSGLACWLFFSVSLQSSARSMIDSGELIKKVRFPRQLVPFSMVATQAVTFAVMIAILIVLSFVYVPAARAYSWASIPLGIVFLGFVAGLSLLIASELQLRDVEHPHRCAPAVVLPHADHLELHHPPPEREEPPRAAQAAALGQPGRAADLRDP